MAMALDLTFSIIESILRASRGRKIDPQCSRVFPVFYISLLGPFFCSGFLDMRNGGGNIYWFMAYKKAKVL